MVLQRYITDEKTEISYTLHGDYYLPDLAFSKDDATRPVSRYGRLHGEYMKQYQRIAYMDMLTSGKLHSYLADISEQARVMLELIIKQMAEKQCITESLKDTDQLRWVGMMNNIRNSAEEIVLRDLIYV